MEVKLPPNLATAPPTKIGAVSSTQVTLNDILKDIGQKADVKKASESIQDLEELHSHQLARRRDYEHLLRRNRLNYAQWMRYARWEAEHNHDLRRFRSIMERALEVNSQHVPFWVRYVELELMFKNVNHARNILERAISVLPKVDKFWFLYVQTEEALGRPDSVRHIFERWLKWKPGREAWVSYIGFEKRAGGSVAELYERAVKEFNDANVWLEWATFEMFKSKPERIRGIFEGAANAGAFSAELLSKWAFWEAKEKERERGKAILTLAFEKGVLDAAERAKLGQSLLEFENLYGDSKGHQLKWRIQQEQAVRSNPRDYDAWWNLSNIEELEEMFKNAVAEKPLQETKSVLWRRYVFLFIRWALWEEYARSNVNAARQIYKDLISTFPTTFTFAKAWIHAAELEIRHGNLTGARKVLGRALGTFPKTKLFIYYINMERTLGEWDRVRRIHERWIEVTIDNPETALESLISFEKEMGEHERCVALYRGISSVSGSSGVKKAFVEYLKGELMYDEAREVLAPQSALDWIERALFESTILSPDQIANLGDAELTIGHYQIGETRKVFDKAYQFFKKAKDGELALIVLGAWQQYEEEYGTTDDVEKVTKKEPKLVDGTYVFPQYATFLAKALQWAG